MVYAPRLSEDGRAFEDFEGLAPEWQTRAEYMTVFPNVMLGVHRDHTFAILLDPVSVNRTVERIAIFYAQESALAPEMADLRQKNAAQWKEIFVEDIFVVEGMQKGRSAPGFDGGKFSPAMDDATHVFHDWVAVRMGGTAEP
ncbi:MAG: RHO alpha subunit C-terminal catalytic domain-containing protein [Pseudomonadota bacterium]